MLLIHIIIFSYYIKNQKCEERKIYFTSDGIHLEYEGPSGEIKFDSAKCSPGDFRPIQSTDEDQQLKFQQVCDYYKRERFSDKEKFLFDGF